MNKDFPPDFVDITSKNASTIFKNHLKLEADEKVKYCVKLWFDHIAVATSEELFKKGIPLEIKEKET